MQLEPKMPLASYGRPPTAFLLSFATATATSPAYLSRRPRFHPHPTTPAPHPHPTYAQHRSSVAHSAPLCSRSWTQSNRTMATSPPSVQLCSPSVALRNNLLDTFSSCLWAGQFTPVFLGRSFTCGKRNRCRECLIQLCSSVDFHLSPSTVSSNEIEQRRQGWD